jgi:hypothetical protein
MHVEEPGSQRGEDGDWSVRCVRDCMTTPLTVSLPG